MHGHFGVGSGGDGETWSGADARAPYTRQAASYQRHVDPDWVNHNSLLLSYSVKKTQIQPQAGNVRPVVERNHHVFNLSRTKYSFP